MRYFLENRATPKTLNECVGFWENVGFLDGLPNDFDVRANMSMLFEKLARFILNESNFKHDDLLLPLARRIFVEKNFTTNIDSIYDYVINNGLHFEYMLNNEEHIRYCSKKGFDIEAELVAVLTDRYIKNNEG